MFEKEAEEAGNEKIKGNYQFARCARKSYKDGFKDGAEFGYNKAKEIIKDYMTIVKVLILHYAVYQKKIALLMFRNLIKKQSNS